MRMSDPIIEDGVIAGNLYPKYSTHNPVFRRLIDNFLGKVDRLVGELDPPSIHEVGCGEGHLISRYAVGHRKLRASDFSAQVIALAQQLAKTKGLSVEFEVRNIYSMTAEQDSAALVICSEVLEHLERPAVAVDALASIASPYLVASVPREPLWRMLNVLRGKYLLSLGNTPGHLQHWSKHTFLQLLSKRFDILQVQSPVPWTLVLCRVKT